ncbi:3-hydroxyacyl-CoA dehydrogenase family protein [Thermodesulfobacteriota bacterium]
MKIEDVKNVAVLGAGVMGNSIALVFARKGYNVRLWSRTQKTIDRAVGLIKSTLALMSEYGHVSDAEIPEIIERILPTTDLSVAAEGAHFALETVAENPDVKKDIFSQLNKLCSKDTVLSSNTSGLDIFTILDVDNPGRLVNTHWFSPATLIPLVEVAPGKETSPETVTLTVDLLKGLGKRPIVLKEFVPAFIVNRIQDSINKTTFEILDNGWATAEDIDTAIKNTLGIRLPVLGVAQVLDFNGLDLIDSINKRRGVESKFIEEKVKQGHFGAKSSKGIYDYGDRTEAELLEKRDRLFYKMLDHLEKINAFEPL